MPGGDIGNPVPLEVFDHNPTPPRRHFTVFAELHFEGRAPALPIDDSE
jgi:hypothetical protein